jgi:hypothetical protein
MVLFVLFNFLRLITRGYDVHGVNCNSALEIHIHIIEVAEGFGLPACSFGYLHLGIRRREGADHGLINYKDTKTNLNVVFTDVSSLEFIDCRYSQSCWFEAA